MNRSIGIVALRVIQAIALIALIRGEQVRACDDFSGPAITIEGIEVRTNGQTVAVYTDNAFYDPAVNNEIKLDFRGWSACAVDEAWGAQPLNAVIDGGAIDIISFASEITGCSGGLHAPKLGDNFGPIWTPGPHTVRIEGTTRDASCSWVSVNSRPVTIWVADSNGQYGIEPKDCESEIGNPVNIVSGKMYHQMTDLVIQGSLPIHFTRRFDSKSSHDGPMGYGWQHNYMVRIDSTSATTTTLIDEQMRRVNFNCAVGTEPPQPQCLGVWHPNAYDHLELIQGTDPPWRVKNKHGKTWDFDSNGNLTKITDRNGNWNQIAYPNSGLITVTDNLNRTLSIALVGGRVDHITAGDRTVSYVHDTATGAAGNLLTVTATNPNSEITVASYGYDSASHRLRTATDANGNLMESHDYTSGRVTHTESDDGNYAYTIGSYSSSTQRTVTNERDTPVMTTFTIDPRTGFTIDREGGPGCSSCGDAGDETHLDYDDHFDLRSVTDGEGVVVEMDYDSNGNLLTRTEAPGTTYERTTSYEYDDEFNLPTAIRVPTVGTPSGHHDGCGYWRAHKVIALERNLDNGNIELASMLGCDGTGYITTETAFTYNSRGQIETVDGPRTDVDDVTSYVYYESSDDPAPSDENRGRLESVTNALDHTVVIDEYDYFGNILEVTDANNVKTEFAYDINNRITEVKLTDPGTSAETIWKYEYDDVGNLERVRTPNCLEVDCDYTLEYAYDSVNRLKEVHDLAGNKLILDYDVEGNKIREETRDPSNALRYSTNFSYDDFNRLEYVYLDDSQSPPFYQYSYFGDGMRKSELDPEGHLTQFTYDLLKRLRTVSQEFGEDELTTEYGYDVQDNLVSVNDPRSVHTGYLYNDMGLRSKTYSEDAGDSDDSYDEAGNQTARLDANGVIVSMAYDELNRLTEVSYPDSDLDVMYTYDSTTYGNGIGRRTGMVDPSGESTFIYDARGLMYVEIKEMGGETFVTWYELDSSGNLVNLWYPESGSSGRYPVVHYEYDQDQAERVSSVHADAVGYYSVVDSIGYEPFGPRASMTFGNELADARSYDTRYRLGDWTLGPSSDYALYYTHQYDEDDNLTSRVDHEFSATRTFGYDEVHRLINAAGPWGAGTACEGQTYTYDASGNRLCKGEASSTTSYSYGATSNRLVSATGAEAASYSYDDNGNTIDDGTHTFEYDEQNRLATVDDGAAATYTYDGEGRRAIKEVTGEPTTYYLYDRSGRLLTEMTLGSNPVAGIDYMYLDGTPIGRVDWSTDGYWPTKELFYYHTDHLGTPIAMTNLNGGLEWKAEYFPFGELFSVTGSEENNLRFPGQYFDSETGLSQNWFRDYSAKLGRYIQPDPIGLAGGLNPYSYAENRPATVIDPMGLEGSFIYEWIKGKLTHFADKYAPQPPVGPQRAEAERDAREYVRILALTPREAQISHVDGEATWRAAGRESLTSVPSACGEQVVMQAAPVAFGAVVKSFSVIGRLEEIWGNPRLFQNWLKGNQSLTRLGNPLSHVEASQVLQNARRLRLQVDLNPMGLQGLEKTGQWADIPHFKVGSVHIPVEPGFVP